MRSCGWGVNAAALAAASSSWSFTNACKAAALLEPKVRLAKVDTQSQPTLAQRHGIRSIPTIVLFHQGREIARQSGAMDANNIVRWTRQHLGG